MSAIEAGFYRNGRFLCLDGKRFTNCMVSQPTQQNLLKDNSNLITDESIPEHKSPPVKRASNPFKEQLVASTAIMPLLHQGASCQQLGQQVNF